jgi:O-antigen ligase
LRLLLALTIIAAPFDITMSFQGFSVTPLALCGGAAVVLLAFSSGERYEQTAMALAIPLGIGLLASAVARATSPLHYLLLLGSMVAIGILARRQAGERGGPEFLLAALVASASVQAAIAIWEYRTHNVLNLYGNGGQAKFASDYFFAFENADRPAAAFYDPISLGNILAIALPIALALFLHSRTAGPRVILASAMAIISVGLALTLSRMSWIGAATGVVLVLCFLPARRLRAAFIVAAMGGVALVSALTIGGKALSERFSSLSNPTAPSVATAAGDRTRQDIWGSAWHIAWKHEIVGTGFGHLNGELSHLVAGIGPTSHAHSTYLQVFAEAGVIGLAAVAIVLSASVSGIWRGRVWHPMLAAGLLGSLVALLICWTTDVTVRYLQVAVFVAVILGAAAGLGGRKRA